MAREPRRDDGIPLKKSKGILRNTDNTAIVYQVAIGALVVFLIIVTLFCGGNTATKDKSINELYDRISILNEEIESQKYKIQRLQKQNIQLNNKLRKNKF